MLENRWLMVSGLNGTRRQGLDMTQAESIMRLRRIKRKERTRILEGLLVMEPAALAAIYGEETA